MLCFFVHFLSPKGLFAPPNPCKCQRLVYSMIQPNRGTQFVLLLADFRAPSLRLSLRGGARQKWFVFPSTLTLFRFPFFYWSVIFVNVGHRVKMAQRAKGATCLNILSRVQSLVVQIAHKRRCWRLGSRLFASCLIEYFLFLFSL